ncbi:MAG: heat-inducible transcriptional repressor HrcA [Clostridia bacterium]|nr:heat-inducible transcriptional repressor HrcA [Clostridia bacterium]
MKGTNMDLNERKLKILQAIVADFISTSEPVGSRTLSKRLDLDLSPATIRNEMSDLEDMGYLTHPHTSAGRVPSDKAYRLYVDQLMSASDLPDQNKQEIEAKLSSDAEELDQTVEHAAHLLSEMTNLVSFAITPNRSESKINYINFLPVDEETVVLMIVCEDGKVTNSAIKLNCKYQEDQLTLMSKVMTHNFKGKTISAVLTANIADLFENDMKALSEMGGSVVPSFMKTLEKMLNVDLYMDGYSNIFALPEYNDVNKAKDFLSTVTNKDQFTNVLVNRDQGLSITIGDENSPDLSDCALITADYKVNGKMVGRLGVIGPKRMKYDEVTSVIKYITENLNQTFEIEAPDEGEDE